MYTLKHWRSDAPIWDFSRVSGYLLRRKSHNSLGVRTFIAARRSESLMWPLQEGAGQALGNVAPHLRGSWNLYPEERPSAGNRFDDDGVSKRARETLHDG